MKYDINGVFIKLAINKGIKDIKVNSKRGIRNLVDLGRYFSNSSIKEKVFKIISDVLQDEDSMYYEIVEKIVYRVDEETLKKVSYNLGYNSISRGSIRLKDEKFIKTIDLSRDINLLESKALGVYAYIIEVDKKTDLHNLYKIIKENQDLVFLIKINEHVNLDYSKLTTCKNFLISINYLDGLKLSEFEDTLKEIRKNKFLYAIHYYIKDEEYILNGKFLKEIEKMDINIAFLINTNKNKSITDYVINSRWHQKSNVFLVDLYEDIDFINALIKSNQRS